MAAAPGRESQAAPGAVAFLTSRSGVVWLGTPGRTPGVVVLFGRYPWYDATCGQF
ncbi:hypothetical protein [Nocardioides acrostichi]|uniref:Uncharacterized protein n=1 Tax=Nocardioides acrostichi TaxID=2784339 RepID=A0A930UX91_9ACTN|nr:hypothetical protein [Nocardioides acrostichi]MBF4162553.1 hypothetical protein [Nocardioides acrostichi]